VDRFYALLYDADRATVQIVEPLTGSSYTRALDSQLLSDTLLGSNTTKSYPHNGMTLREQLEREGLSYWSNGDLPLAWLGAPMVVENRTIGALVVENHRKPNAFGQTGSTMLTTIARQTAVAIENARLHARRERTIARQRAVHTVGQKLSEAVRLGEAEIFRLIDEQASTVMDTNNIYIALYDPTTDIVSFPLMRINGVEQKIPSRSGGRGRTEWIIENRQPILIKTKAESKTWYEQPGRGEYIANPLASWIGVPMMYEGQVLGVIAAYHETNDYVYDREDLEVLQTMAAETAVALENARLYHNLDQRVRERTEQLTALQDIGVKIASTTDLEEALDAIVKHANEIMAADLCVLFPYDHEKHVFEPGIWVPDIDMQLAVPSSTGFTASIVEDKEPEPYFAKDATVEPGRKPKLSAGSQIRSFACVPLIAKKEPVGVLYVNYLKPHTFLEEEREIIQLLCNQAAVALDNARLLADLNERNAELRRAQATIAESESVLIRTAMAADFVHHMNNLAGTIPVRVDQAKNRLSQIVIDDPKLSEYLGNIKSDAERLLRAAEQWKKPVLPETINIKAMLNALIRQAYLHASSDIDFDFLCPDALPTTFGVEEDLRNAIWSIMKNGIEAMPNGGRLLVEVSIYVDEDEKAWIKIYICDEGVGFADPNRAFRPFYTTKEGHIGYGLWRARNIFEKMEGSIDLNTEQGAGTMITIVLPTYEEVL
jgi:GAF domain-containing protein/anti-sigma regulatory factor (Ser/Thr protein kinase)